jgi:hypothetical protein
MERNAGQKKAGPENEASDTKNRFPIFERSERTLFGAKTPWGWKGSSIGDGWGCEPVAAPPAIGEHWGKQTRLFLFRRSGGVGGNDACKLAHALRE